MANCLICLQRLRPPVRVLPCCHSFCLDCLRQLRNYCGVYNVDDGTISVNCPNCRQEVRLDKGKVSTLPTNFALNELLESCAVASVTTVPDEDSRSDLCDQHTEPVVNDDETSSAIYARFQAIELLNGGELYEVQENVHENISFEVSRDLRSSDRTLSLLSLPTFGDNSDLFTEIVTTREEEEWVQSVRSFRERIRHFLREGTRQINELTRTLNALSEEVDNVTDTVTISELGENFGGVVTEESTFETPSGSYSNGDESGHDSTNATLENVTGEFTDLATDHDSAMARSTSSHGHY